MQTHSAGKGDEHLLTRSTVSVKIQDTGPATAAFWTYRNPVVRPVQPPWDIVTRVALFRGARLR